MSALIVSSGYIESACELQGREKSAALDFLGAMQRDPSSPGLHLERLEHRDDVWSGRISRELRAILVKDGGAWILVHAGHHDPAYDWARRRRFRRHAITGGFQIVEPVETVRQVIREQRVEAAAPLFQQHADAYLLSLGVPEDWLPLIRELRDEDQLLQVVDRLPPEVHDRLLALYDGELVTPPPPRAPSAPIAAEDTLQRSFAFLNEPGDLRALLRAPLERWVAFLHPTQRELVTGAFSGPVKVSGGAGTGKTVVAMHRARHLARQGRSVLLASYVTTLCQNIAANLELLCEPEERARIEVATLHSVALGLVRQVEPRLQPANDKTVAAVLDEAIRARGAGFSRRFIKAEWEQVIQAQGLRRWSAYLKARRKGRRSAIAARDKRRLWSVFEMVFEALAARRLLDWPGLCLRAAELLDAGAIAAPFSAVVIDEVQDLRVAELTLVRALAAGAPERLMLCGDAAQRIYPGGFSLKRLGIPVVGRSRILRLNYRTTEQIRRAADKVIGEDCDDMDGGAERRADTRSLLRGPAPRLRGFASAAAEAEAIAEEVCARLKGGVAPEAIAIFARAGQGLAPIRAALSATGIALRELKDDTRPQAGAVAIGTMHRAKGLEFKQVIACGCSAGQLPHPAALRDHDDPLDENEARERERRLLYVVMTRARDDLLITWSGAHCPFLEPVIDAEDS